MLGYVSQTGVGWLIQALTIAMFVSAVWALVDCATRAAPLFEAAGKLTKQRWLLITGGAVVVQLLPVGVFLLLNLIALVASIVYLVDVRPALQQLGGGRGGFGRRGRGGGPGGSGGSGGGRPTGW